MSTDGSSPDDWSPVYKTDAVTEPEPVVELAGPARPKRNWFSGWCGAALDGKCHDGGSKNKVGEPIRRCSYVVENGSKAPYRFLYCACTCHNDSRIEVDPLFGSANQT